VENRTKIFAWCVDWKLGRGQIYGKLVSSLKFSHMCLSQYQYPTPCL
jgi:hypothetical protein